MFNYSKDLRPDSLSIIAKLFNNYMSIEDGGEPLYDLRYENRLFEIIQVIYYNKKKIIITNCYDNIFITNKYIKFIIIDWFD